MKTFIEEIGDAAMLEMLAEECAELTQAALKFARYNRGENPTPQTYIQCLDAFTEEIADVQLIIDQFDNWIDKDRIKAIKEQKMIRWTIRMNKAKEGV
jgi:NTP pyrophosphatase (non-canonical NTP hydrolase)